jgi:GTP cyclohydrolase II
MCEEDQIRVKETGITFFARGPIIPKSNKEKQHYLISAKWSQSANEEGTILYEAPDEIFV